jgi:uncharacterized membrane protein HdeD (DUF308 family)
VLRASSRRHDLDDRKRGGDVPTETIWRQLGTSSRSAVGDLDLDPPGFEEEGERLLARNWKVMAAQGLLWILCGVVLVAWPDPGPRTLAALLSVLALADGLMSGFAAFALQLPRRTRRWLVVEAVVAVTLGVALLAARGVSSTTLLYVIAAWAVAKGVLKLNAARRLPLSGGRELLPFWGGIVSLAFGVVMFVLALVVEPAGGAVALRGLIAAFAIVDGVMQIVFALDLRSVSRRALPGRA